MAFFHFILDLYISSNSIAIMVETFYSFLLITLKNNNVIVTYLLIKKSSRRVSSRPELNFKKWENDEIPH